MKTCSACGKSYGDDLSYCLEDGTALIPVYENRTTQRGFYGSQPPKQGSSPILLLVGGGLALTVLAVVALIGLLIWFAMDDKKVVVANTVNGQPQASPVASPQGLKSPAPSNQNGTANTSNSNAAKPSPTPTPTEPQGADFSKGFSFAGTATNTTVGKSSGAAITVVSRGDSFYVNGGLDNVRLFGQFKNLPGRRTNCPTSAQTNSTCVQFSGDIYFGNDGSNFPAGTKAPFSMLLTFDPAARTASGTYQVGKIPRFEDMGTQHGTFRLARRENRN